MRSVSSRLRMVSTSRSRSLLLQECRASSTSSSRRALFASSWRAESCPTRSSTSAQWLPPARNRVSWGSHSLRLCDQPSARRQLHGPKGRHARCPLSLGRHQGSSLNRETASVIDQPYANHNGGMIAYGKDGLLYVGMGDGGSAGDPENRAQDPSKLLGKILRLDPAHPGSKPDVVGVGLRNPWRFSFDRKNGDLWVGDVGESAFEEVDHVSWPWRGPLNFGWDASRADRHSSQNHSVPGNWSSHSRSTATRKDAQ